MYMHTYVCVREFVFVCMQKNSQLSKVLRDTFLEVFKCVKNQRQLSL